MAGANLNLLNFAAGTNLDVSHSALTNSYEFALSSGTWQDSLGVDTGSNLLVVLDSVLTGTLSVDSALATDISLSSNLGTLDQVLLRTQGAVSDAPGTQLQTNGALSITAGTVLIGEQLADSYQLGELNLDTQGLTEVHAVGNLVVANADSANDIMLFADSLDLQNVASDGSLSAQSRTGDILVGSLMTDGDIFLSAQGGSILDAQDDVLIDLDAGGAINLTADHHILAFGVDQFLEVADGSRVTARSLVNGNIQLQSLGSLELTQLFTADGNMTIRADGVLSAIDVDSSTTDSAANFINLTATGPNGILEIHRVVAGTQNARVSLIAAGDVLDGDNVADDLDVSAKTVSIHAQTGSVGQQVGVIGSIFQETYQATAGVEVLWTDSLTINAGTSAILNPTLGTGVATLNSVNTVVISNGDLDASNIDVSGSTNVALIADADQSGSGNLKLAGNVSVSGDLRIQGADVVSALPLSFNASRFMLISGQAESFTINSFIPNSLVDLDSRVIGDLIVASQSDLRLVDLNGDNFSVSSSTGSIVVVTDAGAIEQLSRVASTQNLLLRASEDLISSASANASGNLSLIAGDDVQLKSLVQTTSGGTVFIEAGNSTADGPDGILMSASSQILTAHSNAHLAAGNDGNISVQSINVGQGSLSLVAEGSILGATASHFLIANALRLEADAFVNSNRNGLGSIGLANPTNGLLNANSLAIHTQVSRLSAISAEGIYLVNTGSVVVGTVDSVVVQRVNRDGTLSQNVDRSLSDLTTTNGPIKLQTIDGGIRVTDGSANSQNGGNNTGVSTQAGDVLLQALGLNATISIDSAVRTQGGALHVAADLNIFQNSDLLVAGGVNNPARNSIVVESLSGSIAMSGSALASTQDGNIVYSSANDTTLGQLTAGLGSVAVVAGGSILDGQLDTVSSLNGFANQTGQARVVNIQALDASLRSGSGIGAAGNPLDVDVSRIAVSALGSAYLYETNGLVVGSVVAIDATRVNLNSTTTNVSVARLEGAVSTNGHVKIETQLGQLEIASAVSAQQDVLLVSGSDNVVINDTVQSQDGAISVLARQSVQQNASLSITTGNDPVRNSVLVQAVGGSITMQPSVTTSTRGGNIACLAATDVSVGILNAGSGSIFVRAGGSILDAQTDTVGHDALGFATSLVPRVENLTAASAQLVAGGSVGISGNPLDTSVDRVAINATGSVYVYETNGLTIDSVTSINTTRVHLDSTTALIAGSQLSGVTSTSGHAKLETISGALTVQSAVAAQQDVLLVSGSDNVVINDTVQSQDGAISVLARQSVQQNANVSITSGNDPVRNSVLVQSLAGSITMQPSTTISTGGGNIAYLAATDVSVGILNAASGSILIRAGGSILDAQTDTVGHEALGFATSLVPRVENLIAASAQLVAGGSVGISGNPLDMSVNSLAINASGSVYVYETNGLTIDTVASINTTRVHLDSTTALITGSQLSGVTSTSGHAKLETISGALTVGSAVVAQQDVLLVSGSDNVVINNAVQSQDGAISVLARQSVQQNASVSITSGNDPVRNSVLVQSLAGSITMQPATTTSTRGGNIAYLAATDVSVGILNAGSGSILIRAGGSILDAQTDTVGHDALGFATSSVPRVENLIAASAQLVAGGSVGISGNPLDMSVNSLAINASGSVYVYETNGLTIDTVPAINTTRVHLDSTTALIAGSQLSGVTSTSGHAKLETIGGALTVQSTVAAQQDVLLVSGSDNVVINNTVQSQDGAISVMARQSVLQNANVSITSGNDPVRNSVLVQALGGSITMQPAVTTSTRGGNIAYLAATDVSVGILNAGSGSILIRAGGSILDAQTDTVGHDALGFATSSVPRVENLIAASAQLVAGGSVGISGNPLDMSVDRLAINATGSVYVYETNGLAIDTVPAINTTRVHLDSTTALITGSQLSGVTSTSGHAKLETISGPLTVASAVVARQDILLASGSDNVVINNAVQSQDGAISMLARQSVQQNANVTITSGNDPVRNSVLVQAFAGLITMQPATTTSTRGGNIAYLAATDVSVGILNAGSGSILIRAGGSILDAQTDTVGHDALGFATSSVPRIENLIAASAQLVAGGSVGISGNPLDTSVDRVAINATGSVYVYETNGLTIDTVASINTTRVHLDSTTALITGSQLSGVTSTTGHAKLETISGALTVGSAVAAQQDVLLVSGSDNVAINDTVQSQDGAISVLARQSVLQNANLSITTGNDSVRNSVLVQALAGSITMQPATTTSTRGGNIAYLAAADVSVGVLSAGSGSIFVRAGGSILDAQTDTVGHDALGFATSLVPRVENLIAASAQLVAGGSVGISGNPLDASVDSLAINATGSVYVYETNGLTIDTVASINTTRVHLDSTTALITGSQLSGVTSTTGHAKLETISGALTVGSAVAAQQDVLLVSGSDNVAINDTVQSQDGAISVLARQSVLQNANVSITSGNDSVRNSVLVQALAGSITMQPATTTSTRGGNIAYLAAADVSVGVLSAGSGSIFVRAGGSILDAQTDTVGHDALGFATSVVPRVENLIAASAQLVAGGSVGVSGNPLDASVDRLAINATGSVYVYETNGLTIDTVASINTTRVHLDSTTALIAGSQLSGVTSTSGHAKLETISGALTVGSAVAAQQNVLLVSGSDNVVINNAVQSQDGAISVLARQSVLQNANLSITSGNDSVRNSVLVQAIGGSITMQPSITTSTGGGNIAYSAATDVSVGVLSAGSGSIFVRAGGSILDAQTDTVGHDALGFATSVVPRVENLTATSAQLVAGGSVGISGNPLDTSVDRVAINATGSVYVYETNGLTIDTVASINTTRVHLDSTTALIAGSQLSGVTSTSGHAKLETISGALTVGSAVVAQQDVLLVSGSDNVAINDAVQSQDGAISVLARQSVQQNASVSITSGNDPVRNSVLVQAFAGSITMQPATTTSTRGGNIAYLAAADVSVGILNAGSGSIFVRAGGSILDAQTDTVGHDALGFATSVVPRVENLTATSAQLVAGGSVGVSGNPLDTSVDKIAVDAMDHVYLLESTNIEVGVTSPISFTNVFLQSTFESVASQQLTGIVSQAGHVKLETLANEIRVTGSIAASRDVELATPNDRIVIDATITSQVGAIGIVAGTDILQSSNIQIVTARDPVSNSIYARALNGSISMSPSAFSRSTAGNIVYQAAQNIALGQLNTTTGSVALQAGGVITDSQQDLVQLDQSTGFALPIGVARVENVIANSLSIQAIRVGTNSNPIDINAQVLAISVQESASLLETNQVTIGSVPEVRVTQNHLDSTQQVRSVSAVSGALAVNGFFNLQSLDGSILVDSNANAGVVSGQSRGVIASADVLIAAGGSGDLVIESSVISQQQDAWLAAGRFLVTPLLQVGGTQTAVVEADHLTAYAGVNIFLPNTVVDTVEFKVVGGINVLAPRQLLNPFADQAGTLILDQLEHGPTNTNPNITNPSTPISTDSFQAWQDQFRFTERFSEGYTVFLRNAGSLSLQDKNFDRSLNVTGQQPGVYLETLKPIGIANAPSDLVVSGKNKIVSTTTNQDPGIVLIADQNLVVQGSIELVTPLAIAAPKNQVLNQLALNASAYHAGLGDPQTVGPAGHSVPVTTEYVVDPIRSQTEDYRTHVNQRVLMEFGSIGESGFLTMVHYADNAFQVFRNQGDVSALAAPSEFALQPAQANLLAIGNTTNDAALFTRSTDFTQVDRFFLQNNRDLPTDVVIRRSLDYFLFSNAQSSDPNQIIDHAAYAQEIIGVKSLGTPSLGPITPIPDGIAPPDPPTRGESALADSPLSLILPQIELKQVKSEAIEVAIFRIGFDDRNSNGQVETTELPAFDDVLNRVDLDSKLPISSKNAGQSPSQGEVDEVKARLLETPDQPSGAYAIIRKNADGKQEVLDVFSVRDWPEESKENGEGLDESNDETPASLDDEHEDHDEQQTDASASIGFENREDASQNSKPQPPISPMVNPSSFPHDDSDATESPRIKDGAAVLCTLWLLHQTHMEPSNLTLKSSADCSSTSVQDASQEVSFNRHDRLRRRARSAIAKMINQPHTEQLQ